MVVMKVQMITSRLALVLGLIILMSAVTYGQGGTANEDNDIENQIWLSLRLRKKVNKKLVLNFRTEARQISEKNDKFLIAPSARYKLTNYLNGLASFRVIGENKKKGMAYASRIDLGLMSRMKLNDVSISGRLMYTDRLDDEGFGVGKNKLRLKLDADYEIIPDRLTPYVGVEGFQSFTIEAVEKIRYIAGVVYDISDKSSVNLSYRHEDFLQESFVANVTSLSLKYKL